LIDLPVFVPRRNFKCDISRVPPIFAEALNTLIGGIVQAGRVHIKSVKLLVASMDRDGTTAHQNRSSCSPFVRFQIGGRMFAMDSLEKELQRIYDSEIHLEIGWLWDGGIDIKLGNGEVSGHVQTVAEILPWIQAAIAKHFSDSKYHVERMGGEWEGGMG
jgi:hypothetical protein